MSSKFSLQTPHVVAALPRPIDHTNGRYVVGEVFGGAPGTKKRKRSELAVGIDGEGVNLYDISSARLITSYALPPQSSFTCAPYSSRTRISKNQVERRTYVSTTGPQPQITLFSEIIEGASTTNSSTKTRNIEKTQSQIVHLGTITATRGSDAPKDTSDLLAIKEDGEIQCLDGQSLKEKWTSPASALGRDSPVPLKDAKVEFAYLTNAHSASQGILKGRQDVLTLFPQEVSEDGFNPEIIVIVTRSAGTPTLRTFHIVSLPRRSETQFNSLKSSVDVLLSANLPSLVEDSQNKASFSIQVSGGILQQLSGDMLYTFDLNDTLPKEISRVRSTGAKSFLRLSNTSVMVSSDTSITVYNPKYESVLATVKLDAAYNDELPKPKRSATKVNGVSNQSCNFVAYFPKLNAAVAIADNNLIAVQIEGQQDRHGRTRTAGLLIDSIGCAVKTSSRHGKSGRSRKGDDMGLKTLEMYLPSPSGSADLIFGEQKAVVEQAFSKGDAATFDSLMANNLGAHWNEDNANLNGGYVAEDDKDVNESAKNTSVSTTDIDRRWVFYALSKIFTFTNSENGPQLAITFYPPNVFMWLISTGNMTVANIDSSFRKHSLFPIKSLETGELVNALVDLDPELDSLLGLIAQNHLTAGELLHGIRKLMESLGLFGEDASTKQALLTNGDEVSSEDGDIEEQVKRLEAQAEKDLELAEYQLGPGSGIRGQALSMALSKLYTCPTSDIIYALQTIYTTQEVVSLIYLLRFELARGAWTSRYLDAEQSDIIDDGADIPNNAIILISSLLNNCVDAVGAGGWLSGNARLVNGDPFEAEELITSLKLEVSAALEGIEEAEYLKGLTSEVVRYGDNVLKRIPEPRSKEDEDTQARKKRKGTIQAIEVQGKILPLGLKAEETISKYRVGAGGEVQKRTKRDYGHIKSKKVGKYTLERIIV